ncbi:MAG: hypothetical protein IKR06_05375 [Erysipelotrichaceae bacterium]|nr:hypothetical protein [Erysipelotrichaceae bacterium]
MSSKHILCIGEASVDFLSQQKGVPLSEVKEYKKRLAGEAELAVKIARRTGSCALLSKVGNDRFGKLIRSYLQKENVDTRFLYVDKDKDTTVSFTALDEDGNYVEKQYLTRGADLNLQSREIGLRVLENVSLLHYDSYSILSDNYRALSAILSWSYKMDAFRAFSLANDLVLRNKKDRDLIRSVLNVTDLFCLNEDQLKYLTGLWSPDFACEMLFRENNELREILVEEDGYIHLYCRDDRHERVPLVKGRETDFLAAYLSLIADDRKANRFGFLKAAAVLINF